MRVRRSRRAATTTDKHEHWTLVNIWLPTLNTIPRGGVTEQLTRIRFASRRGDEEVPRARRANNGVWKTTDRRDKKKKKRPKSTNAIRTRRRRAANTQKR